MAKPITPPRQPQPSQVVRRRNRAVTREALVKSATKLFASRGYEATTTKAIAADAGFSEALIQLYFKGKEGLLLDVIQNEGGGDPGQIVFFERPLCSTLEREAAETMRFITRTIQRRSAGLRIVMSRVLVDVNFRQEFIRYTVRNLIKEKLTARLTRYRKSRALNRKCKPEVVAELIISLSFQVGFIHREVLGASRKEIDESIDDFAEMLGRSLSP